MDSWCWNIIYEGLLALRAMLNLSGEFTVEREQDISMVMDKVKERLEENKRIYIAGGIIKKLPKKRKRNARKSL